MQTSESKQPEAPSADLEVFNSFLASFCFTLLDVNKDFFYSRLHLPETQKILTAFTTDIDAKVLTITRLTEPEPEGSKESTPSCELLFDLTIRYKGSRAHQIAFLKREQFPTIELKEEHKYPVAQQVQVVNLGYVGEDATPFDITQTYVEHSFLPLFSSYQAATTSGHEETKTAARSSKNAPGLPLVQTKLAELKLALLQCKQSLEIPSIELVIDPEIKARAEKAKEANKKLVVDDFADVQQDNDMLNRLSKGMTQWTNLIRTVTTLDHNASTGSALQEINFWLTLERELRNIEKQVKQVEVQVTLEILKRAKKFHVTTTFESDTQLDSALNKSIEFNQLMRDFPINELLSATEIEQVHSAITHIFTHLNKVRNVKNYSGSKMKDLIGALGRDVTSQMLKILSGQRLMELSISNFYGLYQQTDAALKLFKEKSNTFFGQFRQMNPRDFVKPEESREINDLRQRIRSIYEQRNRHEQLLEVVSKVLLNNATEKSHGGSGMMSQSSSVASLVETETNISQGSGHVPNSNQNVEFALQEIKSAFQEFMHIEVLDLSKEGHEKWQEIRNHYDNKVERVENQLTTQLREQLARAKNANEMFRVFSRFNALFFSPRISGAVQEYQSQLLVTVRKDIESLRDKFLQKYEESSAAKLTEVRDMPFVFGQITWHRQIERKLDSYMAKVKQVLGSEWEKHSDGAELKKTSMIFQRHLNTDQLFKNWQNEMRSKMGHRGANEDTTVFKKVERQVAPGHPAEIHLDVDFDEKAAAMFKEVRNLGYLGKRLLTFSTSSGTTKQLYTNAISLRESLRTYYQIRSKINEHTRWLLGKQHSMLASTLIQGLKMKFSEGRRVDTYKVEVANKVLEFEDTAYEIMEKTELVQGALQELQKCELKPEVLSEQLQIIQKIIDEFNFKEFSNLQNYTNYVDEKIIGILTHRLSKIIPDWINEFENFDESGGTVVTIKTIHELKIKDQVIYLEPSLEQTRAFWYQAFHDRLQVICGLPRVQSSRYESKRTGQQRHVEESRQKKTYALILSRIDKELLKKAYSTLQKVIDQSEVYIKSWLSFQVLWDLDPNRMFQKLGDNTESWRQLMGQIRAGRKTFDSVESEKHFGPIVVDFRSVQSKVTNKYDAWHKEVINKFGQLILTQSKTFYDNVRKARFRLEGLNMETDDVTVFVSEIQQTKRKMEKEWSDSIEHFRAGQKLLERQRFQFPADWLDQQQLEGEWSSFLQVLKRKADQMDQKTPILQAKILAEQKANQAKIKDIQEEWKKKKPLKSSGGPGTDEVNPTQALDTLNILEQQLGRVKEEYLRVVKAKELLDMEWSDPHRLDYLEEDIEGLKEVWIELNKVWSSVDALRDTPFTAVVPKKLRDVLSGAIKQLDQFPNRLRQYESYDAIKLRLQRYLKMNATIRELRSEAMKPRHWRVLLGKLRLGHNLQDILLGGVWDVDLIKNEKTVNEVLMTARGELILEEFLRKVREYWNGFELELVKYGNKCRLIKGWDDLFTKVDEDINNLSSMKMSPYYKVFEEEITPWDDRLQKMRIILDTWIEVQRRWVYLESIFFGSEDIKTQLSAEFTRFKSINNEFVTLMKKAASKPNIIEVMSIPNLSKTLERLAEMLSKIQKALGDYLETQRSNFARFYFVGDQDLLEIIGNSKDVKNVQRHFTKMFAGITGLVTPSQEESPTDSGDLLTAMVSREGERVDFDDQVRISVDSTIHVWLGKIQEQMHLTLAKRLQQAVLEVDTIDRQKEGPRFLEWIEKYPAQIVLLSMQVSWSQRVESSLTTKGQAINTLLEVVEQSILQTLVVLAERVLIRLPKAIRQKYEQLITDLVHQRDVTRQLMKDNVSGENDFQWLYHMRLYWFPKQSEDPLKKLSIRMASASFYYGFEYLGVGEKLVQTPLTDRCYLTLTQALHWRMGGSPFGPAGTGKTESVKALGSQMGRFVLVFNCDETFDFKAMGRIFVGLCQVGAWGCFDEFNRLEERMLSAVSQQILAIQTGLRSGMNKIELLGKQVRLNPAMGIFITMNPDYAGRSNLPDNLKQLFRQIAMVKPDRELIAQVMLYSQGFRTAELLAGKIVSLFELCNDQLSSQPHYDFGLRALKPVLVNAGNLKRSEKEKAEKSGDASFEKNFQMWEQNILLRTVCNTIVPKLIAEDVPLLSSLLSGVFPGSDIIKMEGGELVEALNELAPKYNLVCGETFIEKVLQLYQIQELHHGIMMVGPTGSGKTAAWRLLLDALQKIEERSGGYKGGESYIIDPKAITKDDLYGRLDSTTLEWTDGVFTQVLRKILDNQRGESTKLHWIIFDGDVDPLWAENLNSVLDDNKLLTLPSGERLQIPPNVRIMFEVETLKHATQATVSRCGMVWFSEEVISVDWIYQHYLFRLLQDDFDALGQISTSQGEENKEQVFAVQGTNLAEKAVRKTAVDAIRPLFQEAGGGFVTRCLEYAEKQIHVMEFTRIRALEAFFALLRKGISNILDYNDSHPDFPMTNEQIEAYMRRWVVFSLMWGFGGSETLRKREEFSNEIHKFASVPLPSPEGPPLLDYEVSIETQEWVLWKNKVPHIDIDPTKVTEADVVITTVDTLRHQEVLCSWLSEHRPFLLCGPPGSGKTMTLMATLKALPDFEMIFVNFSSSTTPALLLKTFDHYCEFKKTPNGTILRPRNVNKWLVVFCDEINLPDEDDYGTQPVISFLRELTEQNGFWRPKDKIWISLERIQFVGACNPPTDSGRHPLSPRFLRHAPLILVDFPGEESLRQIYGTFNRAMLKRNPGLRGFADQLTEGMVDFYSRCQRTWTADIQPHYIYSPRELTRWKYAINEALDYVDSPEDLVRLFAHEALRLFQDRMVTKEEKDWCDRNVDEVCYQHFGGNMNIQMALERPILFSTYLENKYESVNQEKLRDYVKARLKTFYEEEMDVPLVVFDSVLDHILRIDRVLKQPIGHMLLVGASGVGKTTLSRFVSWMNNLIVFQIKAGRNYSVTDFDEDLRNVMKKAGVKQERICFIFDESNALSVAFLERMNALLASGEVPGLFDGEDYMSLIHQMKEAQRDRHGANATLTDDELYRVFTLNVQRNLHVVFTMNPASPQFFNRTASSPALFNRCVIDWFGEWSNDGLSQVAAEFTAMMELLPTFYSKHGEEGREAMNDALVAAIVQAHKQVKELNQRFAKSAQKFNYITPRDFLDFIKHYVELFEAKKNELEEQQIHLNGGLSTLAETNNGVRKMEESLNQYREELQFKEKEANKKLQQMVAEQNIAEQKREEGLVMKKKIEVKSEEIAKRTEEVEKDLSQAMPALEEAQNSVSGVTKKDLNELRQFANPPKNVKMTLQAVIVLVRGLKVAPSWPEIKQELRKDEFIPNVISFDKDAVRVEIKKLILDKYLKTSDWNLDKIQFSSKAAYPLAKWVQSLLFYAELAEKIQPMRDEVTKLKFQESELEEQYSKTAKMIQELEDNIAQYKADYASLITEVQRIKTEMEKVQDKVKRAQQLNRNLSSESSRWKETQQGFTELFSTLLGDTLLGSAFLTYNGYFDHGYRHWLQSEWRNYLEYAGIKIRADISLTEFLSKPSQRLKWVANKLPEDDLAIENAIILANYNRYPLIIDPAGQCTEYLLSFYANKKIMKSSFADDSFIKHLETALRFGLPILIQDVERVEPVLNSVLNREIQKTGGRILIRLGDQEIDFSQSFNMFMVTRDPNAPFTPDICSRVTFVNFTVTMSSLQNQCLNLLLKNERPDVDARRTELLRTQGEYRVRLRELEDGLLDSLNKVEGRNILEDETVISTLETLKKESAEIAEKVKQTDDVIAEVNETSRVYEPVSKASARIFFTLQSLGSVHFLYQFSLQFFMDIIHSLLNGVANPQLKSISKTNPDARLKIIFSTLFSQTYRRVNYSLLNRHKLLLALRLSQIQLAADQFSEQPVAQLLEAGQPLGGQSDLSYEIASLLNKKLNSAQQKGVESLASSKFFKNKLVPMMKQHDDSFNKLLARNHAEDDVPECWADYGSHDYPAPSNPNLNVKFNSVYESVMQLCVLKVLRPDRFMAGAYKFVENVFGEGFLNVPELDLQIVAERESTSKTPILLVSARGHDASQKVDELARRTGKKVEGVAIGSAQGFQLADSSIRSAVKVGNWVLLKNVHLAPQWLAELEKRIYSLTTIHRDFRLFMTMEINPKVPGTLLRISNIFVFEPPAGVKAALQRAFANVIIPERIDKKPIERSRLHFLLGWFHAVVQERLRFAPIGWSKTYEFNEADQKCALDTLDEWLDQDAGGKERDHIHPDRIPWGAIRALLSQSIYGGKVDNQFDQNILESMVLQFFNPRAYNNNYPLFRHPDGPDAPDVLRLPDLKSSGEFREWVSRLPQVESPLWSGLPVNAERILREQEANQLVSSWRSIQGTDEENVVESGGQGDSEEESRASWLVELQKKCEALMALLPTSLTLLHRTAVSIKNPLFRFLERQVTVGSTLLDKVRLDLKELLEVCQGTKKSTNELRSLADQLHVDMIPKTWRVYRVADMAASEWVIDFQKRLAQLKELSERGDYGEKGLWLGGLFFPEAFLTATRQKVAHENKWSLEELELVLYLDSAIEVSQNSFEATGMSVEGAEWKGEKLIATQALSQSLDRGVFMWIRKNPEKQDKGLKLPVYLNESRKHLLFSVKLAHESEQPPHFWYQRGLAFVTHSRK